jgi:hypothetical protein
MDNMMRVNILIYSDSGGSRLPEFGGVSYVGNGSSNEQESEKNHIKLTVVKASIIIATSRSSQVSTKSAYFGYKSST